MCYRHRSPVHLDTNTRHSYATALFFSPRFLPAILIEPPRTGALRSIRTALGVVAPRS